MRRFVWIRRGEKPPHYELICNGSVVGSLSWVQGSTTTAVAEVAGGVMIFRREGLLRRHIVIENLREETLARITFSPREKGGELKHPNGAAYHFSFDETLEWSDEQGITLSRIGESSLGGGSVIEHSHDGQTLPLLLAFAGWYLFRTNLGHDKASVTSRRTEPRLISPQTAG